MRGRILQLDNRPEVLPVEAEPPPKATGSDLAGIAASLDRLIGMQLVLAERQERLESRLGAIHLEMQSNMNAYLGWTQEFANRTKAQYMATWYFHPGVGTDSPGNGSIGSPCNTLGYTVNTIASSGDTVLGYGGSTSTENAVLTTPVTIGSYGTGQVTIAGGTGAAISVTNADGYTINNIAATGATATYVSGNAVGVIQFLNTTTSTVYSNGTTITNCTITGVWQCGILMIANSTTGANGYRNITIAGNNVSGGLFIGIFLQGDTSGTYEGQHFSNVTIGTSSSPNVVHGVNGTSAHRSTRSRATGSWSAGTIPARGRSCCNTTWSIRADRRRSPGARTRSGASSGPTRSSRTTSSTT